MYFKRIVTTVMLISSIVSASDIATANTDSLQLELQRVNNQLKLYEPEETTTTPEIVYVEMEECKDNEEVRERRPGFGGSGGMTFGFKAIDLSNLKVSIADDIERKGEDSPYYGLGINDRIEGDYKTTMMFGAQGLAGMGNGLRIGGGIYGGSNILRSVYDENDSLLTLVTWMGYGGFIMEKSFDFDELHIILGTIIGGGSQGAILVNEDEFDSDNDNTNFDSDSSNPYEHAIGFAGEIHTGISYSFTSWLHIGLELSGLLFVSDSGYKNGKSFTTFNPGGNLRFMFGRIS